MVVADTERLKQCNDCIVVNLVNSEKGILEEQLKEKDDRIKELEEENLCLLSKLELLEIKHKLTVEEYFTLKEDYSEIKEIFTSTKKDFDNMWNNFKPKNGSYEVEEVKQ